MQSSNVIVKMLYGEFIDLCFIILEEVDNEKDETLVTP